MEGKLTLETFGEIMNKIITDVHVQMLIEMPEGTQEPTIKDNLNAGGVVQFYILLAAIVPVFRQMQKDLGDNFDLSEDFINGALQIVKDELMEGVESKS